MDFATSLQNTVNTKVTKTLLSSNCYLHEIEGSKFAVIFYLSGESRISAFQNTDINPTKHFIHIDYDLWHTKSSIILNRLATLAGKAEKSYARECVVARIDKRVAMEFQEEHHLQGALAGKYRYGLFKEGELLANATFSGLRNMRHTENYRSIELLHYCQKGRHVVIGGLSKLINAMFKDFSPNDVMTYIDRDWSKGTSFEKIGFIKKSKTEPQCFEVNKESLHRKFIKEEPTNMESNSYIVKNLGSIKMVKQNLKIH